MQYFAIAILNLLLLLATTSTLASSVTSCTNYTSITDLYTTIFKSPPSTSSVITINICASSNPLSWSITSKDPLIPKLDTGSRIYLNQNTNQEFVLNCISTDGNLAVAEEEESCVIDFTPQVTLEPTDSYGGFVLRKSNTLRINGNFVWKNRLTKDSLFYVQDGSELFVSGSTFRDNGQTIPSGKIPIIVYTAVDTRNKITIESCSFSDNKGLLLGIQAGDFTLKDNRFDNNGLLEVNPNPYSTSSFISWQSRDDGSNSMLTLERNSYIGFSGNAAFVVSGDERYTTESSIISMNCFKDNAVTSSTCNDGVYLKTASGNVCQTLDTCTTSSPSKSPTKAFTDAIVTCDLEVVLHIVDQTRSSCPNNKVSCKDIMTNSNVDTYFDDGIEVRVAQLSQDYSANEAGTYFDSAPPGYAIASGNIDDSCLTYPEASEGMINIGIACATFKSTNQRVCTLSEDLAPEGTSLSFEFMSLIKANSSGATKTQARGAKSKRVKGNGKGRLLQEEENIDDLVVTFPQDWVWGTNEELFYPMILSSATIWEVDACLLLPPGHELVAVMNANSTEILPIEDECTHTITGDYYELVLLFEVIDEESPWGTRALRNKKARSSDIHGHIEAKEKGGSHFKKPTKKIDFSTAARTRRSNSNNVKKVFNGKS